VATWESLKAIGRAFGKPSSSIYFQVAPHGGIRPARRRRSRLALTQSEREELPQDPCKCESRKHLFRLAKKGGDYAFLATTDGLEEAAKLISGPRYSKCRRENRSQHHPLIRLKRRAHNRAADPSTAGPQSPTRRARCTSVIVMFFAPITIATLPENLSGESI
jgi:hypothetical protein